MNNRGYSFASFVCRLIFSGQKTRLEFGAIQFVREVNLLAIVTRNLLKEITKGDNYEGDNTMHATTGQNV